MNRHAFMLLLVSVLLLAEPKTPPRQWQPGKFKDAESGQYEFPAPPNAGALTRTVSLLKSHSYTGITLLSPTSTS